jgi:hypothetical protein
MTRNSASASAQSKIARQRAAQKRRQQKQRAAIGGSAAVALAGVTALVVALWPASSPSNPSNPASDTASAAVLAPRGVLTGSAVDGIQSGAMEQLAFHIHAHVAIYVDGQARLLPAGIGIIGDGAGFYWLHTHDQSGVVHMEAPVQRGFTLGDLFDMWEQPLSTSQVGPAHGPVAVFVDGRTVTGDPRAVPLDAHAVIQLDVGTAVAFRPFAFPDGL